MHSQCQILDRQPVNVTLMVPNYFLSLKVTHGIISENFAYVLNGWPPFLTSESHEPTFNAVGGESHHIQILGRTYFPGSLKFLKVACVGN